MDHMRDIPGFPGYQASEDGRIWSTKQYRTKGHWLKPRPDKGGYLTVRLSVQGSTYTRAVHRLVATAYHGPCPDGMETRHLNGVRTDNRPDNLRWGTKAENGRDVSAHGGQRKERCVNDHPFEGDNLHVRKNGKWECRTCMRERARRYRANCGA